ncbi:heavy metal translocatin [Karstenula rhodostoma CBS 690.94]|uniref:Heavy metal translocatin n=1 Tax=Karstenula rhodostoma CBS 690.94 TaxID=1392251 RepID=A0A9P4PSI3_9PLEO|nr:heavy metal translocatin [Karstenula rhodostoma CBS 690.94]
MSCYELFHHSDTEPEEEERIDEIRTKPTQLKRPANMKRIILTIEGLKCGCCGDSGISRALEQIPGVQNHHVNVVLARAEFDLDVRTTTVGMVRRKLTAVTGYTFNQYFQPDGQILEVVVDDSAEMFQNSKSTWVPRVFSGRNSAVPPNSPINLPSPAQKRRNGDNAKVHPTDKRAGLLQSQRTVHIHYNAKLIGARDVLQYYERYTEKEIQLAPPAPHPSLAVGSRQTKSAYLVFLLAAVFTVPVVVFAWGPVNHSNLIYAHLSLAFASVVQVIAIREFFPGAIRTLIHAHIFDMDSLVALSTSVAYIYSVISYTREVKGKPLETGSFFETSTLLVTLILLGRVVSEFARSRAAKSVSFRSLQVDEALLVLESSSPSNLDAELIDARLLQYGDVFKVLPESRIVTDGTVIQGGSEVDESMITGEALPVAKGRDSIVHAGTVNGSGNLIVALKKLPHENSVSKIATLVENTELTKPKAQAIADRVASWFVPSIIFIALLVFTIWIFVDKYHYHRSTSSAAIKAFTYAIATFVVSCPCAIGLAVPMVVLIASGVAARLGIIFRDPQKLETARNVTDIVFDKTGTLTDGVLTVERKAFYEATEKEVRGFVLGLLDGIKHPVSVAAWKWAHDQGWMDHALPVQMTSVQSIPGEGIQGTTMIGNHVVQAGNPTWLGIDDLAIQRTPLEHDHTLLCLTVDGVRKADFFLKSHICTTAKATIKNLHGRGIRVHMITGDHEGAAASVAEDLSIPTYLVKSHLKPAEKQAYVDALQADGKTVMFVGDGTNDAVALKASAIGVHINRGSDVAKSAADIVLINYNLLDVCILLDISRAAYRRIVLNFAWSFVYNSVAVLLAAGAFRVWRIEPKYAGLGELVSVLPVVGVAFSMRWRGYGKKYKGLKGM